MNVVSPRPSGLLSIESMMKCGGSDMVFISMPQRMGEKIWPTMVRILDPLKNVVVRQYIESETAFVKLSTGAGKFSSNLHHNVPSSRARTIEI